MNGVFELICIILAFIAIMIIFAALRSIQEDVNEIYGRVYNLCITAEMILTRVSKPEPEVSAVAEAYEQGKKDAHIWTPTAESLPPLNEFVLVSDMLGRVITAYLTKDSDGVYIWITSSYEEIFEKINAWQKLPEPYREDEE